MLTTFGSLAGEGSVGIHMLNNIINIALNLNKHMFVMVFTLLLFYMFVKEI